MVHQERLNQTLNFAPGAVDLSPRVLRAMNRSFVHSWNEEFLAYHDETVELLRQLFGTVHDCVTMMAPIRGGLDAAIASITEPGDEVLVLVNGYWSHHLVEIVQTYGAQVVVLNEEWGKPYDIESVRRTVEAHPGLKTLVGVHVETSTGVVNPVEALGALVREKGLMFVLDVAQSLGGMSVKVDEWGVDLAVSGTHKCMSAPAGMAFVTVSPRAWQVMENRSTPIQAWSVSLLLARELWLERKRLYFTFSVTLLYALRAMLDWMFDMGLDELYRRYQEAADRIRSGVSSMGLSLLPEAKHCANTATAVRCPEGVNGHDILDLCLKKYGVALAGGLGPLNGKIFRLGPTGEMQLMPENIEAALRAVQKVVEELRK